MSRKFIEVITSDLSGDEGAESVTVPGFTIDLTASERAEMWKLIQPYLDHGTKVAGSKGPKVAQPPAPKATARTDREQNKAMREWLTGHGYELSDRGRIPQDRQAAYESRTPAPGWVDPARPAVAAKPPVKAPEKAAAPPKVPPATFSNPPTKPATVTAIKPGRTGARSKNATTTATTGGRVAAAAKTTAAKKTTSAKVARS